MKCYKIYERDQMGYEGNTKYCKNYNKAIEVFNSTVKNVVKDIGGDIVDKFEFGEEISSFKEWNKNAEIISRKYPYLLYKENLLYKEKELLTAQVFHWEREIYEYEEYDIVNSTIVLEVIEVIE